MSVFNLLVVNILIFFRCKPGNLEAYKIFLFHYFVNFLLTFLQKYWFDFFRQSLRWQKLTGNKYWRVYFPKLSWHWSLDELNAPETSSMIDYFGDANKTLVIIFPSRPKWTAFTLENVILQRCSQNISLLWQLYGPKMPKRHLVLIFLFLILNLFKIPHNACLQSMFQLPIVHVWRLKACLA